MARQTSGDVSLYQALDDLKMRSTDRSLDGVVTLDVDEKVGGANGPDAPSLTATSLTAPSLDSPSLDSPSLDSPGLDSPGLDTPSLANPYFP